MSTIQALHDLVNVKETQAGSTDRITGAEVRAVDNAIIDELPVRGVTQVDTTAALATYPVTESKKVLVPDNGTFVAFQTANAPDNITTFPSATSGWVWKRETHNVVRGQAKESNFIVAHDTDDDKLKQSVTLKTLTDWIIQNFEPRVQTIEDVAFIKVMGGFMHAAQTGQHRRILLDEAHNRFYTVGAFDAYKGKTLNCISRFYLDGSADEEFNANAASIFNCYYGQGISYSGILFGIIQADGKPIVAGYDFMVQYSPEGSSLHFGRVNQDGTIDQEYLAGIGTGIEPGYTYYPRALAIQPDQKIIITGDFWAYNGGNPAGHIVRIFPDGSQDIPFQNVVQGLNQSMYTVLVQPDGKIVMAGDATQITGVTIPRMVRLNADGTIDTAFTANLGTGPNGTAYHGLLQPDGKIVLAGSFNQFNGVAAGGIVRINADGTVDTAFAANHGAADSYCWAVALQADGKILLGGSFNLIGSVPVPRLARFYPDGTLDTDYNAALGAGFSDGAVQALAVQSDGRIIAAGGFQTFQGQPRPSGIVRLLPDMPSDDIIPPWQHG
jgi:uncharacterized delta-60 repeat protein